MEDQQGLLISPVPMKVTLKMPILLLTEVIHNGFLILVHRSMLGVNFVCLSLIICIILLTRVLYKLLMVQCSMSLVLAQ